MNKVKGQTILIKENKQVRVSLNKNNIKEVGKISKQKGVCFSQIVDEAISYYLEANRCPAQKEHYIE